MMPATHSHDLPPEAIEAQSVTVALRGRPVLRDVSLCLQPGELLVLIGPNGAGKTTLLRTLCGDLAPSQGLVLLGERNISKQGARWLARRRSVMTQSNPIAFEFSVADVMRMGWLGRETELEAQVLPELAARWQLTDLLPRVFNTLSGGEQQRVHFVRALLQLRSGDQDQSRFLFLDEPNAGLDLAHEQQLLRAVRAVCAEGIGAAVVLHDLNLAARFADRIALLREGELQALGDPAAVLTETRLSDVYGLPLTVERHGALERLVVYS